MQMVGQVFGGSHHALETVAGGSWRGHAGRVARADDLVPGTVIPMGDGLLDGGVTNDQKAPGLHVAAVWRRRAGLEDLADQVGRDRVRLQPPHGARGADGRENVEGHILASYHITIRAGQTAPKVLSVAGSASLDNTPGMA